MKLIFKSVSDYEKNLEYIMQAHFINISSMVLVSIINWKEWKVCKFLKGHVQEVFL